MSFNLKSLVTALIVCSLSVQTVIAQSTSDSSRRQLQPHQARLLSKPSTALKSIGKVAVDPRREPVSVLVRNHPEVEAETIPVLKKSSAPKQPLAPQQIPAPERIADSRIPGRLHIPADVRPVPSIPAGSSEHAMPSTAESSGPKVQVEKIDGEKANGNLPPLVGPESILRVDDFPVDSNMQLDNEIADNSSSADGVVPPTQPVPELPSANAPLANAPQIPNANQRTPSERSFPKGTKSNSPYSSELPLSNEYFASETDEAKPAIVNNEPPTGMSDIEESEGQSSVRPLAEARIDSNGASRLEYSNELIRESIVPIVSLETVGPREFVANEIVQFRVIARNLGEISASDIRVELQLPANVKMVRSSERVVESSGMISVEIDRLEPNAEREFTFDVQSAQLGEFDISTNVSLAGNGRVQVGVVQPQLAIQCDGPSSLKYGEQGEFKVRVTNTGDGVATNIVVASDLPEGFVTEMGENFSLEIGALRQGEMREIILPLMAESVGNSRLRFSVQADHELSASTGKAVTVLRPAVTAEVQGPDVIYLDREAVYAITVSNPSKLSVTAVKLKLLLPEGLHVTSIDQAGDYDHNEGSLLWTIPVIDAGRSHTVQLKATATQEGKQIQSVQVTAAEKVSSEVAHATMVISRADLSVVISDNAKPIKVGERAEFMVSLKNNGTKAARNVQVEVTLSNGLRARDSAQYTVEGTKVIYDSFKMEADQMVNLRLETVGISSGDQVVRVSMKHAESNHELIAEESVFYYDPVQKRVASQQESTTQSK